MIPEQDDDPVRIESPRDVSDVFYILATGLPVNVACVKIEIEYVYEFLPKGNFVAYMPTEYPLPGIATFPFIDNLLKM